ncbi:MAG: hypothetical protein ACKO29_01885 [Actinomycetota bacterium]
MNSLFVLEDAGQAVAELFVAVILTGLVYLLWIKPKMILKDEAIEIINPLSTVEIPYRDIQELQTKWALAIIHSRGKTSVWAAPASGKRRWIADKSFGWYGSNVPLSESKAVESETMSESLNSHSGQAAYLIRERIKRLH